MNREIRKLIKKVDELQKQINYQTECIIDQSLIIHKLKEKIIGYNPYNENPFTWPTEPKNPYENPHPWREPWNSNNVKCPHCGKDTGIPMLLNMVIPPEGLKCPHCNKTAVYSMSPTCQEQFSTTAVPCINTKVSFRETTTPVYHTSYDGTKTSLPVTVPEKWQMPKAGSVTESSLGSMKMNKTSF